MGNSGIGPSTVKQKSVGENLHLIFGSCEMQGWREQMVTLITKYIFCIILCLYQT